jgi:glycosyltransferase involved in cell wall biosynthesis
LIVYGLDRHITGIGRYTLELARALSEMASAPVLTLLTAGGAGLLADMDAKFALLPGCRLLPGLITLGGVLIPRYVRRHGLDLVHDPTGITPFYLGTGAARAVVTVHDVFPWSCPGTSSLLDTLIYRHWLPRVLPRRADTIITVSEHSRGDIQRYLGIPSQQLNVIPYGVAARFHPLPAAQVDAHLKARFGLAGPYILYVGALTRRKNVERALQAFATIQDQFPAMRFALAGPRTWKQTPVEDLVQALGIGDKILLTGPLADGDLAALYSGAKLFLFPSLCEGFGLPPLEAMACGTPVVCSNATSLPEVVGDAALTVDPHDVEALAEAIGRVLSEPKLAAELRTRSLERAQQFTWQRTARETMGVYNQVLGEARGSDDG